MKLIKVNRSYFYAKDYPMFNICKFRRSEKEDIEYIINLDGKKFYCSEVTLVLLKDLCLEVLADMDELIPEENR